MSKYKTKMRKLIIMPAEEDIQLFQNGGKNRANNNDSNQIREDILANIFSIDKDYFIHSEFGSLWTTIREKFRTTLNSLCDEPFGKIIIKQKGGMRFNYDFLVTFLDQENIQIIKEVKLEFKHNNSNITKLPQFLELFDKDCKTKLNICQVSYAEFFYDTYLDQYLQLEEGIIESKPTRETYLKNVYDIKYKHPFFKNMYDLRDIKTAEKRQLATTSISAYLQAFSNDFNFKKIEDKIKDSQKDKLFMLWDCENFHIQTLDIEDIQILGIKKTSLHDLYFDLNIANFNSDLRIRINWGNNACVANPRWKFSFI